MGEARPDPMPRLGAAARPAWMSAADWHTRLLHQPRQAEAHDAPFAIRRLSGTPPLVAQPALSEDIVCLHLGGAKRVHRWHEGKASVHDVPDGALTIMPRGIENRWKTIGPVDYLHIVLQRDQLERIAEENHSGDPARVALRDVVGIRQPLIEAAFAEMHRLSSIGARPSRLHAESLLTVFTASLLSHASSACAARRFGTDASERGGLGGWRMRRVIDYIEAHHARDIALDELTVLTGLSRAHFYRAFHQSLGMTPARYVSAVRAEHARALLAGTMTLGEVAAAVGLADPAMLANIFRRHFGISPRDYRRALR